MKSMKTLPYLTLAFAAFITHAKAASMTWDLSGTQYQYPAVTDATAEVQTAIQGAITWFQSNAGGNAVIKFGSGTYQFLGPTSPPTNNNTGSINVSGVNPGVDSKGNPGQLTFQGAAMGGKAATILLFTETIAPNPNNFTAETVYSEHEIYGNGVSYVKFASMHLAVSQLTPDGITGSVCQGTVTAEGTNTLNGASNKYVQVTIPTGFPTPADVYDGYNFSVGGGGPGGRYIRSFTYVSGVPEIGTDSQIAWDSYQQISGSTWELDGLHSTPSYAIGTILGIKSKHGVIQCYFKDATNITFNLVQWTDGTGLWFFGASDFITITKCQDNREADINGLTPCLASSDNGPTVSDNAATPATSITIENNTFTADGDDAIAPNYVNGGTISGNTVSDDFARAVYCSNCPHINDGNNPEISTSGNTWIRCPTVPASLP